MAELLIALGILGVIATFTIPKVLQSQQSGQYKSVTKEIIASVADIYNTLRMQGQLTSGTTAGTVTPYLNYVKLETSSTIDDITGFGTIGCTASDPCYRMHSGGVLRLTNSDSFGGTASTNATPFMFDPDGAPSGTTKAIRFFIYFNGRVMTHTDCLSNTWSNSLGWGGMCPNSAYDPSWFSWN